MKIGSLIELAQILDTSNSHLQYIINNEEKCYTTFLLPKRTGVRVISCPNNPLKKMQKIILKKILMSLKLHSNAIGFVKGKNIIDNCKYHTNQRIIYNTDIKDFFPSIGANRIYPIFGLFDFHKDVKFMLTELCTFGKQLPQGAPTSPYLSNLVARKLDLRLTGLAIKYNLNYTRYADDLTFSGNRISMKVVNYIREIVRDEGFKIAKNKERIVTNKNSQKVTGLIVNDKVSFGRKNYLKLRSIIFNCTKTSAAVQNRGNHTNYKAYLYGKVAFLRSIDKDKAKILKAMLDGTNWDSHSYSASDWKSHQIAIDILEHFNFINYTLPIKLFKDNNKNIVEFIKPVTSQEELNSRTQSLWKLFDEIDPNYFLSVLPPDQTQETDGHTMKSRRLIESFTQFKGNPDARINKSLKHIMILAAGISRHNIDDDKIKAVLYYYRQNPQYINCSQFWHSILVDLLKSLREFIQLI